MCTHSKSLYGDTQIQTMFMFLTFKLLSSAFVSSSSSRRWRDSLSRGSFQVLSHSFKCRETSKSPQILNLHLFPSSEGQPPEHHLTHCRIRPDLNRNPALVSWQVSMPLSSADVRQLLESTRLALWAFHRKETRVWWPSACKPNSFGKHLDA